MPRHLTNVLEEAAPTGPRVFVPNEPMKYGDDGWVRQYDLTSATRYGELVHLTPPGPPVTDPTDAVAEMRSLLEDYGPDDFLLMVGHPAIIAVAAALAARSAGGRLNTLTWRGRGRDGSYHLQRMQLW